MNYLLHCNKRMSDFETPVLNKKELESLIILWYSKCSKDDRWQNALLEQCGGDYYKLSMKIDEFKPENVFKEVNVINGSLEASFDEFYDDRYEFSYTEKTRVKVKFTCVKKVFYLQSSRTFLESKEAVKHSDIEKVSVTDILSIMGGHIRLANDWIESHGIDNVLELLKQARKKAD